MFQSLSAPSHPQLPTQTPTHSSDARCTCYPRSLSVLLVWRPHPSAPPHPLFSPLSPVKSPRGPDHSKANMWFELASQKPALHTWGCVRNPRARWSGSACVVCNCERRANCVCVCDSFYKYMPGFVSLKRKYYFACGCILTQEVSMLCLWGLNKTKN